MSFFNFLATFMFHYEVGNLPSGESKSEFPRPGRFWRQNHMFRVLVTFQRLKYHYFSSS